MKLLCNLVTEDASREQVVKSDGIFGVFHCLVHSGAGTLRYALACFLNLTFHPQVAQQICFNGGLAHLLGALQRSASDSQATVYGIKALSNLAQNSPSLSIVAAEFGACDHLLGALQTAPQAVTLQCLICLQCLASHPANKADMLTAFLPVTRQCLPVADPTVAKGLLQVLALLAGESYSLASKAEQDTQLMHEVEQLLLTSSDESLVRKCLRLYLAMAAAGAAPTTAAELHRVQEAKRFMLSSKGDKLIQKVQQLLIKPPP